jgi:hypothetical protein
MQPIFEIETASWTAPFGEDRRNAAITALEEGRVLYFPRLAFALEPAEADLVRVARAPAARKNITFDPRTGAAHGAELDAAEQRIVSALLDRYGRTVEAWFDNLFPAYAGGFERARATFRPAEISGRDYSPRKDDRRLHVDAFPSRPTGGRRILRVFTNVNPFGENRVWEVGEDFESFARRFAKKARPLLPFEPEILAALGVTKGRRTGYDHLMNALHDRGKLDAGYQEAAPRQRLEFPPGSTWMCFTDQVLHAALAGRGVLEQTLLVEPLRQARPERAPIRVLERVTGRALA